MSGSVRFAGIMGAERGGVGEEGEGEGAGAWMGGLEEGVGKENGGGNCLSLDLTKWLWMVFDGLVESGVEGWRRSALPRCATSQILFQDCRKPRSGNMHALPVGRVRASAPAGVGSRGH